MSVRTPVLGRRHILALAAALPAVAGIRPAFADGAPGITKDQILLGGVFALTGPVRLITEPYEQGIRSYFNRVNKAGGINGRQIKYLVEDDAYTPAKSLAGAKKLVERDGVAFLFGQLGTQTTAAIAPYAEQAKVPFFTGSPNPATTRPHTFGLMADYSDEMTEVTKYLVAQGKKRIGYLFQNDDLGEAGRLGIERALKISGTPLAVSVGFERGTSDYATQILKLKDANADAVVVMSTAPAVAAAIKQAQTAGYAPTWATYGIGGSNVMLELLGSNIKGVVFATELDQFSDNDASHELAADLKASYPNAKPDFATFLGYAQAHVIVDVLKAAGDDLTREHIMSIVESDKSFPAAVMAPIHYGKTSRGGATALRIFEWQGDKAVARTDWIQLKS